MTNKIANPAIPRTMDEILQDYGLVRAKLADCTYIIHIQNKESDRLKGEMEALNNEASRRKALDDAKAAEAKGEQA